MSAPRRSRREQILTWAGVIHQHVRTRSRRALRPLDLPYPQFVLLHHFCHDREREWTVSGLARAFQSPQPGLTKTVAKLVERGWLRARPDPDDARARLLRVTPRGIAVRDRALAAIGRETDRFFEDWSRRDVQTLHRLLERLKRDFDEADDRDLPGDR